MFTKKGNPLLQSKRDTLKSKPDTSLWQERNSDKCKDYIRVI